MLNFKANDLQARKRGGEFSRALLSPLVLLLSVVGLTGTAAAATLDLEQVANAGVGGPFEVSNVNGGPLDGTEFITFCIEKQEHVSAAKTTYDYALSTTVKYRGGDTPVALQSTTAYLYSSFRAGTLNGVGGFNSSETSNLVELQHAIWHTEGYAGALGTLAQALVDNAITANADGGSWFGRGLGNVRVINLGTEFGNQDQLAVVPIPGAIWLFGSGLIAFAGVSRRQSSKNAQSGAA